MGGGTPLVHGGTPCTQTFFLITLACWNDLFPEGLVGRSTPDPGGKRRTGRGRGGERKRRRGRGRRRRKGKKEKRGREKRGKGKEEERGKGEGG